MRCTVRGCQEPLRRKDKGLHCAAGHHFDRAKAGYWSLLQPQDRKSLQPGDSDEAVVARQQWLARGYMAGLVTALRPWLEDTSFDRSGSEPAGVPDQESARCDVIRTLDLGCGEGTFGSLLFEDRADGFCGIDLSKRALRLAARRWPDATWVLANADRTLPVFDQSVHQVISLFGRRPISEIRRILAAGGDCVVAVPGEEDLIELRESVQQAGHRRNRWETVVDEFTSEGLDFVEHQLWQDRFDLEPEAIADALAMTYRAVRHSQQTRAELLKAMKVTLAADLIRFRKGH